MTSEKSAPLLAVDVGNSRMKFGLFDGLGAPDSTRALPACRQALAVDVEDEIPWPAIGASIEGGADVTGVIAGANPAGIEKVLATWPAGWPRPRVIGHPTTFPLEVRVDFPQKVGVDRLLNAVAANRIRPADRPAVIVDTGTATTVDLVSTDGAFKGGAILPGFELCARALHDYTALLPLLSIEELAGEPREPLGRNTRAALRSGLFWGQLGGVKELIERLTPPKTEPMVLLTGGGAVLLASHFPDARWEPHLSLQGLVVMALGEVPSKE